ncbi:unnamed protein product [Pleuronectes platessa]|uniref:Uncharacterized protein n=1 Tax=Pleuronectes platessa TaxID=8262 RepID=A0A9N7TS37_PLEPL|nr:unnamed protein product [Pleuronectes platessa]
MTGRECLRLPSPRRRLHLNSFFSSSPELERIWVLSVEDSCRHIQGVTACNVGFIETNSRAVQPGRTFTPSWI